MNPVVEALTEVERACRNLRLAIRTPGVALELEREARRIPSQVSDIVALAMSADPLPGVDLDLERRTLAIGGERVPLSTMEMRMFCVMYANPERIWEKAELLQGMWGVGELTAQQLRSRACDSHAARLRRKLHAVDPSRTWIENVYGVGYRLMSLESVR